jgi:hypothetical protein
MRNADAGPKRDLIIRQERNEACIPQGRDSITMLGKLWVRSEIEALSRASGASNAPAALVHTKAATPRHRVEIRGPTWIDASRSTGDAVSPHCAAFLATVDSIVP